LGETSLSVFGANALVNSSVQLIESESTVYGSGLVWGVSAVFAKNRAAAATQNSILLVSKVSANRTVALVLRTVDVFETSLVATLFTRDLGKVSTLAKGARRLKSPFQGGLDLLGVSDIVLFPKTSEALDLLAEAVPVERFASLRRDLAALYAGYYIAELLIDLTDIHDPHPRLFDAATITLRHLGDADLRSRRIMRFELACLRELGLMPVLDRCAQCGVSVEPIGNVVWFGQAHGGVVCANCRPGLPHVAALSRKDLEAIRVLASPGSAWRELETQNGGLVPAREAVGAAISHVLGHRPRLRPLLGV
jgi:DNA repair protein RecO (recombination protein O)